MRMYTHSAALCASLLLSAGVCWPLLVSARVSWCLPVSAALRWYPLLLAAVGWYLMLSAGAPRSLLHSAAPGRLSEMSTARRMNLPSSRRAPGDPHQVDIRLPTLLITGVTCAVSGAGRDQRPRGRGLNARGEHCDASRRSPIAASVGRLPCLRIPCCCNRPQALATPRSARVTPGSGRSSYSFWDAVPGCAMPCRAVRLARLERNCVPP